MSHPLVSILLALAALIAVSAARAEPVRFEAAPVNPTPLQRRLAESRGAVATPRPGDTITGELLRPAGPGPFPALVALHGCAGRSPPQAQAERMQRFVALGYVLLDVDSFGPRGIAQACAPYGAGVDRIGDAFGALDWLAAQPFVDPARITALGFDQGGDIALFAVSPDGNAQGYRHRFQAAIAWYPGCTFAFAHLDAPSLVLAGEKDGWARARDCRDMLEAHGTDPVPQHLLILPGALHGFDLRELGDRTVQRGDDRLRYDPASDTAALEATKAFLAGLRTH